MTLDCEEHPLFVAHAVRCVFPEPLGQLKRHADLEAGLEGAVASADDERRGLVRKQTRTSLSIPRLNEAYLRPPVEQRALVS